jgi:hypothetical protein
MLFGYCVFRKKAVWKTPVAWMLFETNRLQVFKHASDSFWSWVRNVGFELFGYEQWLFNGFLNFSELFWTFLNFSEHLWTLKKTMKTIEKHVFLRVQKSSEKFRKVQKLQVQKSSQKFIGERFKPNITNPASNTVWSVFANLCLFDFKQHSLNNCFQTAFLRNTQYSNSIHTAFGQNN